MKFQYTFKRHDDTASVIAGSLNDAVKKAFGDHSVIKFDDSGCVVSINETWTLDLVIGTSQS